MDKLEANKALVRRFVEQVKNERRLDALGEFFAADYKEHNETVASFGPGTTGYQNFLGHLFSAFPDDRLVIGRRFSSSASRTARSSSIGSTWTSSVGSRSSA